MPNNLGGVTVLLLGKHKLLSSVQHVGSYDGTSTGMSCAPGYRHFLLITQVEP
jgi:hypothetical protein